MEVKLEFCGGAESHNNGEKIMTMQFPEDTSLRDIFRMLRGGDVSQYAAVLTICNCNLDASRRW